jgi:Excalibur calcium-binding domain
MGSSQTARQSLPQWWRDRKRKWPWILGVVLLLLFVIAGVFGGEDRNSGGSPEEPPAIAIPEGLTGLDSATARDRLQDLGFVVTIESVDGRAVIIESNWVVVSASLQERQNVLLRVEKPSATTTAPPAVAEVPTTTETPPAEVAPAPGPETAIEEEPAPEPTPDAYYANCAAVRAAGAAPLTAGDPGYRAALDRDKDGVACE